MRKFITFLIVIALIGAGYYYREDIKEFLKKPEPETEKILRKAPTKDIEVFIAGEELAPLSFKKTGLSSSSVSSTVTAQISGKITDLRVEVGDQVSKNELLLTLGESYSTDLTDIQLDTAEESYGIARSQEELTKSAGGNSLIAAEIALQMAAENYENSLDSLENTEEIFDTQLESLEMSEENAEEALKNSEEAYDDLEEKIEDTTDPTQKAQLEAQLEQLEKAIEASENNLEMAELAIRQAEESQNAQISQIEHGINNSFLQYQAAINQFESAQTASGIQYLGSLSQLVQANSAVRSAALSQEQRYVCSPINGIITAIEVTEGNFIGPGQVLLKIENPETISIKVGLNSKEAYLLNIGDNVKINDELEGTIVSISPTINSQTQKIETEIELKDQTSLKPGALAKVEFFPETKGKIFIPLNSLYLEDEKKFVKVIDEDHKIKYQEVIIGKILNNYIEVIAGIKEGDAVLKSQIDIEENEIVNVINGEA